MREITENNIQINRNIPKYKLAVCHLFHPVLHGYTENSCKDIYGHYLVFWEIEYIDEYFDNIYYREIEDLTAFYNDIVLENHPHPTIRNYLNIIKRENYIKIDIVETKTLDTLEEVGYIKTFWLKILQRKWKSIFQKRKERVKQLSNPKHLLKREIRGK
jgi:hypothetical protein